MKTEQAVRNRNPILLADYRPPAWLVPRIELWFDLDAEATEVTCELELVRNPAATSGPPELNGEGLELLQLNQDGRTLSAGEFRLTDGRLTLPDPPGDRTIVRSRVRISPAANTALEGLYISGGALCTQNEPEGFRHITFFPDRPDVMSRYRTTLRADRKRYPVLLSNGNVVAREELPNGRHSVTWEDPYAKPCYLFALVAGDLGVVTDSYTTRSGRRIELFIYTDHGAEGRCAFAMESLKQAMRWDEETFGLEYDLDIYMIVAVEAFNFGAMENKGLNIFNSRLVLADPRTATDEMFERIQGVVAHEYFHNWTGNRVTCRDWFQLTLKEGLTVFRDQQFSADMTQRDLKRIYDVEDLRQLQFPEDAGPMAHPIQPKSYIEINNFYTMTVYEKGAEVIRMIHTLIGPERFRAGLDLYFQRHDGHAVTTGDFVSALEDASGFDLGQFRRWYDLPGTPLVSVSESYDVAGRVFTLTLKQNLPDPAAPPLLIPVRVALLSAAGREQSFSISASLPPADGSAPQRTSATVVLAQAEQSFRFENVVERPVLSILRGFSAPVKLDYERSDDQLAFLMAHDTDGFNRHEAGRELALRVLVQAARDVSGRKQPALPEGFVAALRSVLLSREDESLRAAALSLPGEAEINDRTAPCDFAATHRAREAILGRLAHALRDDWKNTHDELASRTFADRTAGVGPRRLKNICLAVLSRLREPWVEELAFAQLEKGENMTDELAALRILADRDGPLRERALALFFDRWKHESLVMDNWLSVQAGSSAADTAARVLELQRSPVYSSRTPNKVRSLLGTFARNELCFNAADGSGYRLVADAILELDSVNPSVASGLAKAFTRLGRLSPELRGLAVGELERVFARPDLSGDVFEIVSRSLEFARATRS